VPTADTSNRTSSSRRPPPPPPRTFANFDSD
jgi:hypothetical protein